MFELSFGAVCGICAGVFVKKGVKLLAFFLGGVFVLLQVSSSLSYAQRPLVHDLLSVFCFHKPH